MQDGSRKPRKERKENADKRRRQLLDAALKSIEVNGLARTTLATVATEASLSQGVAVFYYKSKNGLLTAVLEDLYETYEAHWRRALADGPDDPRARLIALVSADFDPAVCNSRILSVWFAFWGEQKFTPQYATITGRFDRNRMEAIQGVCRQLYPDHRQDEAVTVAEWIDTLTDGYWQRIHLYSGAFTRDMALNSTLAFLDRVLPAPSDGGAGPG